MATVKDYLGTDAPAGHGKKLKRSILCGIEVELEKVVVKENFFPWNKIKDGSLKDEGAEFTLPVWNTSANHYLDLLFNSLSSKHCSARTSIHVHMNILDFTLEQVKTLILLYIIYEKALFQFSGNRWDSNYCVPIRTYFRENMNELGFGTLEPYFPKYAAMHLLTEQRFGTAEFRHMIGNHNSDYIVAWINILSELIEYASQKPYDELVEQIKDMRSDSSYWNLSKAIFTTTYQQLQYKDFQIDLEEGITLAKIVSL